MSSQVHNRIKALIEKFKSIRGIVAIILFGSYARGDFHEGSDVDLLLIFEDEESLKDGEVEVYSITSKADLFLQAICLTLKEFKKSSLLNTTLAEGEICYAKIDLREFLASQLKPYALVTYSMKGLKPKDRVLFVQRLEGRGKSKQAGMLQSLGGYKVGRGAVMIPVKNLKPLLSCLEEMGIQYVIRYVWA